MGKSTVAAMFGQLGISSHDSDTAVHELISGEARSAIAAAFPYFSHPDLYDKKTKEISRKELGKIVFADKEKLKTLQDILHPLVRRSQDEFIHRQQRLGAQAVILDIPLLFETEAQTRLDYVIAVSAPAHIQKARVMERPGMTEERLNAIISSQMPDAEKCACADFVIQTGLNLAHTQKQVKETLQAIKRSIKNHA